MWEGSKTSAKRQGGLEIQEGNQMTEEQKSARRAPDRTASVDAGRHARREEGGSRVGGMTEAGQMGGWQEL